MNKMQLASTNISVESFCGYCNLPISLNVFARHYGITMVAGNKREHTVYYTGTCPLCGKPIIHDIGNKSALPVTRSFENIKHLPQEVEALYNEMRDAFSIKAYTCCVIAGRTLLANVAVEQGATAGLKFAQYVDYMVQTFMPHQSSKPWVDKVRTLGNASAHQLVIANKENAETSLKFLANILRNVYELPNSV